MAMLASTNVLVAGPEPPGPAPMPSVAGSVSRVMLTPPTVMVIDALPTTLPLLGLENVTLHAPATVPAPEQVLLLMLKAEPLVLASETVGLVPSGTFTKPFPSPAFCLAVTVKVWLWPTSLTPLGAMVMKASTNVLFAGPEPPGPAGTLAVAGS